MLTEKMDRWVLSVKQEAREEGLEQGREESREEGLLRGRKEALLKVLNKRLGPGNYEAKLQSASSEQLEVRLDRAIDAERISGLRKFLIKVGDISS